MSAYYCDDCDHTFNAPTDTDTCRCGAGHTAFRVETGAASLALADPDERRTRYAAAMAVRDGDTWPTTYENDEADYLRRADAAMAVADTEQAAVPSAPADTDLRDRIRRAICEASGFEWDDDGLEPDEYGEHADAVLAVLPAEARRPFDAQAGLQRLATERDAVFREGAEAIDATFTGPGDDRYVRFGADLLRRMADEAQQARKAPLPEQQPTPLRWGLNDVMWGDDDTTTVMLSGPAGEPYWLELDPERAAALHTDLAGPDGAQES